MLDAATRIATKQLGVEAEAPHEQPPAQELLPPLSSKRRAQLYHLLCDAEPECNGNGEQNPEG